MEHAKQDKPRRRLPRREREKLIVAEAIRFFAEVGFEGQTRALAQRLGVTQPLLYRYFPDKDALIERVFGEILDASWDLAWDKALADRSRPLADRLVEFYVAYANSNFGFVRVRLLMFAALKDSAAASRFLNHVRERLFVPLVREIRAEAGLHAAAPVDEAEVACVAGLHGAIGYVVARRNFLEGKQAEIDTNQLIRHQVATFLRGATATFTALAERAAAQ